MKNTDLDPKIYDRQRAEELQLLNYYKNYMNDDQLSEGEREALMKKVQALEKKFAERANNPPKHQQDLELDPQKLKEAFNKMS